MISFHVTLLCILYCTNPQVNMWTKTNESCQLFELHYQNRLKRLRTQEMASLQLACPLTSSSQWHHTGSQWSIEKSNILLQETTSGCGLPAEPAKTMQLKWWLRLHISLARGSLSDTMRHRGTKIHWSWPRQLHDEPMTLGMPFAWCLESDVALIAP